MIKKVSLPQIDLEQATKKVEQIKDDLLKTVGVKKPSLFKRLSQRKWMIIAVLISLLLLSLVFFTIFYFFSVYKDVVVVPNQPLPAKSAPSATVTPTPDPKRDFGLLILGYGGPEHAGGFLTDTMILAYVQPKDQKITLINIPRDTWIDLPTSSDGVTFSKINAAYAIGRDDKRYRNKPAEFTGPAGGGEMAKAAVSRVTGLPVEQFVAVSFSGFIQAVDTLEGIEVMVPVTFDDYFYPIDGKQTDTCGFSEADIATAQAGLKGEKLQQFYACRFEKLHFDQGLQTMDGVTALKFTRSRHSPQHGGDFARSDRQKAVILGVSQKALELNILPKIPQLLSNFRQNVQTDVNLSRLNELIDLSEVLSNAQIESITLSTDNVLINSKSQDGQYILVPQSEDGDWSVVKDFIQSELSGIPISTESADIQDQSP